MRTSILFLVALVLVTFQGWAAPVNPSQAQQVAQSFANANGNFNAYSMTGAMKLAHAEPSSKFKDQPVFYVFNSADSYVIVAGDDRAYDILGYGEGQFDINDIPGGMRDLFNVYKEEIEFLQTHPKFQVDNHAQSTPSLMATYVSPLLGSTVWAQQSPYNNKCKFNNVQCLTGCGATALAQIMYKWKYPSMAPSMSSYSCNGMTIPYLSSTTFQWSYMKTSYTKGETGTSADAVATLMRYVGQALKMNYGTDASSGGNVFDARDALVDKFGYSSSAKAVLKSSYTVTQWHSLMKTELNAGRPIYYVASGTGCHAFVIDGYNTSSYYHINWGWGDKKYNGRYDYNGYCKLGAFNPRGTTDQFNTNQTMIIDVRPKTVVTTSPSSLLFNNKTVGKTYSSTFRVNGYHLTGDLTLTLSGSAYFKINNARTITISKSAATIGAVVTVTYSPTSTTAKAHNATVTISGGGLTSNQKVTLKGTAIRGNGTTNGTTEFDKNPVVNTTTTVSLIDDGNSTTVIDGGSTTTVVSDKDNGNPLMAPSNSLSGMDELAMDSRVYAAGQNIIIESPVDQRAIISDISGHAMTVNLQAGRNEIPVNSTGIYIVRVHDKTTKLMLR